MLAIDICLFDSGVSAMVKKSFMLSPALAIIAILSTAGLMSCSAESKARQAVERGDKLLLEGKREEAALNFKKAIQLNANSGEAYYGLGRALFTPDRLPEAYTTLIKASELLGKRADVLTDLGDAALTLYLATPSRPAALRDRLIKVSDDLAKISPDSSESFRIRGYIQMADRRTAEAVQTLKQGLQVRPDDQRSQLALVKALLLDNRVEEADATALQAISKHKQYFPLYDVIVDHYARSSDTVQKAERFLRLKVESNPHSPDSLLGLARFHRLQKNPGGIAAAVAPMLKDAEHFPTGQLQVADFYLEAESYGPAEQTLREAIASRSSIREAAQVRLARVLFLYRRPDEAFALADQLAKEFPKDRDVVILRAELAVSARRQDRYDLVVAELKSLLLTLPNDPAIYSALGEVLLIKGDLDGAAKELEQAAKLDLVNTNARLSLVNINLQKKNYTEAMKGIDQLLLADPSNLRYRLLRASALRNQRNFGEAKAVLTSLNSEAPNQSGVQLEMAFLDLAEGRASQAEAILRRLFQPGRPNIMVLDGLAHSLVIQNRFDRAMELLLSARKQFPSPALDLLIAEVSLTGRHPDQAIQFYSSADKDSKLSAEELGRYAEALQQGGKLREAITVARRARDLDPQRRQLSVFLAFLLQTAGGNDEAIGLYRTVLKSEPSNLQAANNLAYMLAERGQDLQEANQLANLCVRAQPENDGFGDTLGLVLYNQGKFGDAIEVFQRVLRKQPSQGLYRYHLALAFIGKGDRSQARRELDLASRQNLEPSEKVKVQELLKTVG